MASLLNILGTMGVPSPLLVELLDQTGVASLTSGAYEVLDLFYDQNTNQYYGELKLTLSNSGLKLGLSNSTSVFGDSTMTPTSIQL